MEQYPVIKKLFDRRKESTAKKEGSVEIEIYFDKKRKWISTGVKILPKNWDQKKKMVVGRIDSVDLNLRTENIENNINAHIRKLMAENKPFTWAYYDSMINSKRAGSKDSFIDYVSERVEKRLDIKESTRKNHKKFLNALKEFNKIRGFDDINKYNILQYDEWLRGRKTYTQATIHSYHKFMKVYVNEALCKEYIKINPYSGLKIDRGKRRIRRALQPKELDLICKAKVPTESIDKVRDLFLFQCNTGLAFADLCNFDFSKVQERNGRYVLHDSRQKTGEDYYIVLLPKALEILRKYDFKLPTMSNQQYNMRLKILSDAAGLEKHITTHMGRHTYATMCLNSGVSIETLARMMGHSDIKTTQIYASLVNSTVEEAYGMLEERDIVKEMILSLSEILEILINYSSFIPKKQKRPRIQRITI